MDELFARLLTMRDTPVAVIQLGRLLGCTVSRAGLASHLRKRLIQPPAGKSPMYRHQLGFEKIVLGSFGGLYPRKLRLHIWRDNADLDRVQDVHNHAYAFASSVLIGGLRDTRYRESTTSDRYEEFLYSVNDGMCYPSGLTPSTVRYRASAIMEVTAGTVYCIQTNEMHSTRSNGGLTVSLQLQDAPVLQTVRVARRFGPKQVVASHAILLPDQVSEEIINGLIEVLVNE